VYGSSQADKGHSQDPLDGWPDVVEVLQMIIPEFVEVVQPLCEALRTKQNSFKISYDGVKHVGAKTWAQKQLCQALKAEVGQRQGMSGSLLIQIDDQQLIRHKSAPLSTSNFAER